MFTCRPAPTTPTARNVQFVSDVIEVADLHKSYGDVHAVRGISFSVQAGEIVAVLGPNGAGKTTAIEMLEGYRTPDQGTISVLGFDPATGGGALRQRIGIVLQECGIDPYLSVAEVLRMHAGVLRPPPVGGGGRSSWWGSRRSRTAG